MVLRAKRAKNGRMMYFKDNKLISKDKFMAARKRASGSKLHGSDLLPVNPKVME